MMRRSLLVLAFLGLTTAACAPPAPVQNTAADEAQLRADALGWFDDFAAGNADAVANRYAEDALIMPPGAAAVSGREAIRTAMAGMIAEMKTGQLSLKNGQETGIGVSGDVGWISGNYTIVDATGAVVDSGNYLSVHRRTNGAWPYIRDMWNSDRPPAPAPVKK
jgi:ketosteroid isomerase-like protein